MGDGADGLLRLSQGGAGGSQTTRQMTTSSATLALKSGLLTSPMNTAPSDSQAGWPRGGPRWRPSGPGGHSALVTRFRDVDEPQHVSTQLRCGFEATPVRCPPPQRLWASLPSSRRRGAGRDPDAYWGKWLNARGPEHADHPRLEQHPADQTADDLERDVDARWRVHVQLQCPRLSGRRRGVARSAPGPQSPCSDR